MEVSSACHLPVTALLAPVEARQQQRREVYDPAMDRRMVDADATLGQHCHVCRCGVRELSTSGFCPTDGQTRDGAEIAHLSRAGDPADPGKLYVNNVRGIVTRDLGENVEIGDGFVDCRRQARLPADPQAFLIAVTGLLDVEKAVPLQVPSNTQCGWHAPRSVRVGDVCFAVQTLSRYRPIQFDIRVSASARFRRKYLDPLRPR